MAKASETFGIPELLESILLKLPPKDLLFAQRVSTTWRDTIKSSCRIQQALFYKHRQLTAIERYLQLPGINPFVNNLLALAEWVISHHSNRGCTANYGYSIPEKCGSHHIHVNQHRKRMANKWNLSANNASWREMYIIDRPCEVHIGTHGRTTAWTVHRLGGTKLGDLMDFLKELDGKPNFGERIR